MTIFITHKFSNIAYSIYKNNLTVFYFIFFYKMAYVSLCIGAYHDKHLCYKLQISCLSKQAYWLMGLDIWFFFVACRKFGLIEPRVSFAWLYQLTRDYQYLGLMIGDTGIISSLKNLGEFLHIYVCRM